MANGIKQIEPEVLSILRELEIDGKLAKRCPRELDRKTYQALDKVLRAIGGKWNRKQDGHLFNGRNPQDEIAAVVAKGYYFDEKAGYQFFPTSPTLADELVDLAGIEEGMLVLEPSAGDGAIASVLKEAGAVVDCIELNPRLVALLQQQGYHEVIEGDFLTVEREPVYDAAVMNPPFNGGQDIAHVRRAWELLLPGGTLVSIMSPSMKTCSDKKHKQFREWAEEIGACVTDNPKNSFKHAGTAINTITFMAVKE